MHRNITYTPWRQTGLIASNLKRYLGVTLTCILASNTYAGINLSNSGYVDVTKAPYNVTRNDGNDDRTKIQQAIDYAIDNNMAVYLPPGIYDISDTLNLERYDSHGTGSDRTGNLLIGSSEAESILRLMPGKAQNMNSPKPVLKCRQVDSSQANNFNNAIRNLVIDLGNNNPAGVGIDFQGAEGSAITDIKIYTSYNNQTFYAGLMHLPGSGGSVTNLEIIGGKYGIYCPENDGVRPVPVVTACRLINQEDYAVSYSAFTTLTMVGVEIEKEKGPVFNLTRAPSQHESAGSLNLIDATIDLTNPGWGSERTAIIHQDCNIHLRNVYVNNVGYAVDNVGTTNSGDDFWVNGNDTWRYIPIYADGPHWTAVHNNETYRARLINGNMQDARHAPNTSGDSPSSRNIDFLTKHGWAQGFGSPTRSDVISVTSYGATPDAGGNADDAPGIQAAINASTSQGKPVFIPPGVYIIKTPIQLKWNTELFGAGRQLTILDGSQMTSNNGANTAVIRSNDNENATAAISEFKILYPRSNQNIGGIEWKAGRKSIIRDVWVLPGTSANDKGEVARLSITGNGGGRIYNWICHLAADSYGEDMRNVLIQGTTQPLNFYMFHNQHINPGLDEQDASPKTEVFDAQNICFYGIKQEIKTGVAQNVLPTSLLFVDCENIQITTQAGIGTTRSEESLIKFIDCDDISVSNFGNWNYQYGNNAPFYYFSDWETSGGNLVETGKEFADLDLFVNLVLKGTPDFDTGDF